jgi:hypothetical protein
MSNTDGLMENESYAETDEEEARAEAREHDFSDDVYDRMREDNSIELIEAVEEVIKKANNLMYFKNNPERIAKDIINATLSKLKFKIKDIENITPKYQKINLEVKNDN